MRIAISNIAWDPQEDEAVAGLLRRYGVDAIDIAPGKYFPDPAAAQPAEILRVKKWWVDQGVELTGMQALLFGTTGLNVFGDATSQAAMLDRLAGVCRIGGELGATRLVFGSPKNRDRTGLTDAQVLETSVRFFGKLGDIARDSGVIICLEPNPTRYGANFMTTSLETREVVKAVSHPAIRMQLDTGALAINGEDAAEVVAACAPWIGHIHASEPDLVPLGDGSTDHAAAYRAIQSRLGETLVTIEMVATRSESHLESIERAVKNAVRYYRPSAKSEAKSP